jgi:glutathione S-transferase
MPEYKLYYYPFAGGRGEALRVALHHSGVEWENVEMPFGDYQALKADDAADVAWKCGLPVLSVDGKLFTQSLAQLRCGTYNSATNLFFCQAALQRRGVPAPCH